MITKMNFLLTIRPIRRKGEIGRQGVVSKHFLGHCFVRNVIFFLNSLYLKKENFAKQIFQIQLILLCFNYFHLRFGTKIAKIYSAKNYSAKIYPLKEVSQLLQATGSVPLQNSNSVNVCLFSLFLCHLSPLTNIFSHNRHTQRVQISFALFLRQGQIPTKVAINNNFKTL